MDTTDQGSASTRQEPGRIDAQEPRAPQPVLRRSREDRVVAGLCGGVLILVGSLLLANRFLPGFADLIGPLVLVALGGLIIAGPRR